MKKTKIVATLGPSSNSPEMVEKFINFGVNVFRLNFSHGNHALREKEIKIIKMVRKKLKAHVAIQADLQGPKIRVGNTEQELVPNKKVVLNCGVCKEGEIPVQYKDLYKDVHKGERILLDDGKFELKTVEVNGKRIITKVITGGLLTSNKGINLPESSISAKAISEKDKKDAVFALLNGVDFLALSFVKSSKDIKELRKIISCSNNKNAKIIAKIERHEALDCIDQIIEEADGIMVARGDLGMEIPAQDVPIIQKKIIKKCLAVGKPCIVATQMLESMILHPHSTRAETSDIANAILDGADATMLSAETSIGKYPLNSVKAMNKIALNTEKWIEEDGITLGRKVKRDKTKISNAIAMAGVSMSKELKVKYIVAATASGNNARAVSKYRPHTQIIGVTFDEKVARQLALSWGVVPLVLHYKDNQELAVKINKWLKDRKMVKIGDKITIISGFVHNEIGGTNLIRVHEIE